MRLGTVFFVFAALAFSGAAWAAPADVAPAVHDLSSVLVALGAVGLAVLLMVIGVRTLQRIRWSGL